MKFLHLADLHIGKKFNGFSLLDDQKYILSRILDIVDRFSPDAVIIAGDVYDVPQPPADAVALLDSFLTDVTRKANIVFIVPGNHDSAERLSFGCEIMKNGGLYIAGAYNGGPFVVPLSDSFGEINIYMLPFVKPDAVKALHGENVSSFDEAVRLSLSKTHINTEQRNILIAHQFVTAEGCAAELSDSETKYAGGLDNVNAYAFSAFDYVALGHLHCPQKVGTEKIVYSGSPLKYSVSERFHQKCAIIIELREKGNLSIEKIPLVPMRDLRQIKGELETLVNGEESDDFISVVLTDKTRRFEPYKRLSAIYKNIISIEYESERETETALGNTAPKGDISQKTHIEIVAQFYNDMTGDELDEEDTRYIQKILDDLKGLEAQL